ncbi:MAG: hypothetical protein HW381_2073, partial [Candidatus Rokubacteria bacterium]|nr:hypothetical protein [Candidatus Rokubacteria bacterium]
TSSHCVAAGKGIRNPRCKVSMR